jgi:peptidoglycan/xylan/chitin deacetylase (PgdA/CDA1 family)
MLEDTRIGLKVDVDTLRGTREGVPRLSALLQKHGLQATFYFSVGPDNTGRALRRVFRKGFAEKVARTSVVKHYGIKTLMYGVLLPGPHIGLRAGDVMRGVHDAGFEVGLHTFDHVRWQDYVANATASWTRTEFERGLEAFHQVFGFAPASHAAAGWQINTHGLELEREYGLKFASDTRGRTPFWPTLAEGGESCLQLPTTLPTFDELLGRDGVTESNIAERMFERSLTAAQEAAAEPGAEHTGSEHTGAGAPGAGGEVQVFTLHAELEGMRLLAAFDDLLRRWRDAGARLGGMGELHAEVQHRPLPHQPVQMGTVAGRSGRLAVQSPRDVRPIAARSTAPA